MTINTDTSFVPAQRQSLSNFLKKIGKLISPARKKQCFPAVSPHAPPLDNHLRRDIGLPDADPHDDRHLTGWNDPLSVEIRRKW